MTHSRISSPGISQSVAKASMFAGTSAIAAGFRGIGRSWVPKAREASRPTIDPTAMPSIAGAIIFDSPAIIAIIGSSASPGTSTSPPAGVPSAVAISVKRWR